ncbi:hypothetical protein ASL11_02305 [Paenibacillus sp. Soil750]|nr:hypothetical protein ASL11_02305 [Paenibacillus sp. Soil750]
MAQCQSCGDKKQDSELILFDGTPHPNLVDQFKKKLTAPILILPRQSGKLRLPTLKSLKE